MAPTFATSIAAIVLVSFAVVAAERLLERKPSLPVALGSIAALTALVAIQLAQLSWRSGLRSARSDALALVLQAILVYVPFVWARDMWVGTPYGLAASAMLAFPDRLGQFVFGFVVVSIPATEGILSTSVGVAVNSFISIVGLGLAIYGLTRLADAVKTLHETRADLADLVVTRERRRFARDLHDLLSYSLAAIGLKSELVYRLVDVQTGRAKRELESVIELSRQALADVRSVASTYRHMSLANECAGAVTLLSAAGIEVHLDIADMDDVGDAAGTVLATVLREGVTNIFRHSKASRCEIHGAVTNSEFRLTIASDGVRMRKPPDCGGAGVENLRQRVSTLGGVLDAGIGDDGWFRLIARIPLHACGKRSRSSTDNNGRALDAIGPRLHRSHPSAVRSSPEPPPVDGWCRVDGGEAAPRDHVVRIS